jgi:hypothetical protein
MGAVYRGIDQEDGRPVAVKLLAERFLDDPEVRRRFLREAQATAGLAHPNVVGIRASGEHEGRPFLVMEHIDGETVVARLRQRGRLPFAEAAEVAAQVCEGLAHIHARALVHRDIKSQNILMEHGGRAVILDFGILRVLGAGSTRTALLAGTPEYMSPEQALDPTSVDGRSDLYSLGVVIFEMLTGQVPFHSSSPFKVLLLHQRSPVPRASSLVPDIPAALEGFLRKALAKEPEARFQSAGGLRDALHAAVRSPGTVWTRWWTGGRVAAVSVVLSAVCGAGALWNGLGDDAPALAAASVPAVSGRPEPVPVVVGPPTGARPGAALAAGAARPPKTDLTLLRERTPERARPARDAPAGKRRPRPRQVQVQPARPEAPSAATLVAALPVRKPEPVPARDERPALLHVVTVFEGEGTWSRIFIDGDLANESHVAYRRLPAGRHRVRVERGGFREMGEEISLQPGETRKLVLHLERR